MKKYVFICLCFLSSLYADYEPKDYSKLLGMPGFSDPLLKMHFQLYQGYVKNTNLLMNTLNSMRDENKMSGYEFTALKRRLGWEMDGMRLHELYFENMGGKTLLDPKSPLYQKIVSDFGSFDSWKKEFMAVGLTRGIGWVILYQDPQNGKLVNMWINEHDVGHLAGGAPILVMDVFEHAYITQYGLAKQEYIDVFFKNINWQEAAKRIGSGK